MTQTYDLPEEENLANYVENLTFINAETQDENGEYAIHAEANEVHYDTVTGNEFDWFPNGNPNVPVYVYGDATPVTHITVPVTPVYGFEWTTKEIEIPLHPQEPKQSLDEKLIAMLEEIGQEKAKEDAAQLMEDTVKYAQDLIKKLIEEQAIVETKIMDNKAVKLKKDELPRHTHMLTATKKSLNSDEKKTAEANDLKNKIAKDIKKFKELVGQLPDLRVSLDPPIPKKSIRKTRPTKKKKIVEISKRTFWWKPTLNDKVTKENYQPAVNEAIALVDEPSANLVSSLLENGNHAPVLDIDFPARLIPSSTPGHYHLYLDKEMSPGNYRTLIRTLSSVGILESGYAYAALNKGMTLVRKPDVLKPGATSVVEIEERMHKAELAEAKLEKENAELVEEVAQLKAKMYGGEPALTWS